MIKYGKPSIITKILFILYLIVLVWVLIFKFSFSFSDLPTYSSVNFTPFFIEYKVNPHIISRELILNILIFIPFGIYCGLIFIHQNFFVKMIPFILFSLFVEMTQYIFEIGAADINDLITNVIGGIIGLIIYYIVRLIFQKYTNVTLTILAFILTVFVIAMFPFLKVNLTLIV